MCTFSVGVNEKYKGEDITKWFRVSSWNKLAEVCNKFITVGKKVCVIGSISCRAYTAKNGDVRASLEVNAESVEFLSPCDVAAPTGPTQGTAQASAPVDTQTGFVQVEEDPEGGSSILR